MRHIRISKINVRVIGTGLDGNQSTVHLVTGGVLQGDVAGEIQSALDGP